LNNSTKYHFYQEFSHVTEQKKNAGKTVSTGGTQEFLVRRREGGLRLSPQPPVLTLALQRYEEFSFTSLHQE
jgi:hypothetical protein